MVPIDPPPLGSRVTPRAQEAKEAPLSLQTAVAGPRPPGRGRNEGARLGRAPRLGDRSVERPAVSCSSASHAARREPRWTRAFRPSPSRTSKKPEPTRTLRAPEQRRRRPPTPWRLEPCGPPSGPALRRTRSPKPRAKPRSLRATRSSRGRSPRDTCSCRPRRTPRPCRKAKRRNPPSGGPRLRWPA